MPESTSMESFLERLNAGTPSAIAEVYTRYFDRLYQAADRLIGDRLRRIYGPDDAVQSAMTVFFAGLSQKKFHFSQSSRLWTLLMLIMQHKIQKRATKKWPDQLPPEVVDRRPPQEEALEVIDALEVAVGGFKPRDQEICRQFYLHGLPTDEIASTVGCSQSTVRRVLAEFRRRLGRLLGDDPEF
jgi:RNA polymerase sigma factor (sigma-70 family)